MYMNMSSFLSSNKETPVVDAASDPNTYRSIVQKLCAKRKALEELLTQDSLSEHERTEHASSLTLLMSSMKTFGISEIDYQAFLASSSSADKDQLTLF